MGDEIRIVGAGLSGLTCAINLAGSGREVLVLDKEQRHGGRPEFRPDGAASPFDFEKVKAYTGIDISPACHPVENLVWSIFGDRLDMPHQEGFQTYMVERGPRSTSIDTLLYDLAVEAGVRFEWGFSIKSPSDVADLPEGSVIATGLDVQGFEAMGIPYVPFWGWFAKSLVDDPRTLAWAYIDDFTVDYAFTTQVNGSLFALLFQRERPLSKAAKRKFEEYTAAEGLELTGWRDLIGGAAPHRSLGNPVLYKNNMIILGTLAGVMEPMLNFGMLGALVCGRIGAIAVDDRAAAYDEFRRLTSFFRRSMLMKRANDATPTAVRRALWGVASKMMVRASAESRNKAMRFVPGNVGFQ
ncbi:MAG: NAD(P)-binding protein [Actinobacteria bacterium]|nr:NAD(P)-binding protein [Actinomycetota bacterium]MBU1944502.1 NAD(P)-binding protein [Actinomycetota bacterium]MBU2689055.1 NAD(P)-binding protein [Actinomycetota bacterium]